MYYHLDIDINTINITILEKYYEFRLIKVPIDQARKVENHFISLEMNI